MYQSVMRLAGIKSPPADFVPSNVVAAFARGLDGALLDRSTGERILDGTEFEWKLQETWAEYPDFQTVLQRAEDHMSAARKIFEAVGMTAALVDPKARREQIGALMRSVVAPKKAPEQIAPLADALERYRHLCRRVKIAEQGVRGCQTRGEVQVALRKVDPHLTDLIEAHLEADLLFDLFGKLRSHENEKMGRPQTIAAKLAAGSGVAESTILRASQSKLPTPESMS